MNFVLAWIPPRVLQPKNQDWICSYSPKSGLDLLFAVQKARQCHRGHDQEPYSLPLSFCPKNIFSLSTPTMPHHKDTTNDRLQHFSMLEAVIACLLCPFNAKKQRDAIAISNHAIRL
jgi:hypothetical protein